MKPTRSLTTLRGTDGEPRRPDADGGPRASGTARAITCIQRPEPLGPQEIQPLEGPRVQGLDRGNLAEAGGHLEAGAGKPGGAVDPAAVPELAEKRVTDPP